MRKMWVQDRYLEEGSEAYEAERVKRARREKRRKQWGICADIAVVMMLVSMVGVPVTGLVTYQFGHTYNQEIYPLDKASAYLDTAQSFVPANYNSTALNISYAWALVNQSDKASGYGAGSPCWLWPVQSSSYRWVDIQLAQAHAETEYAAWHHQELGNTTVSNTTAVKGLIQNIANDINNDGQGPGGPQNIAGCLFAGQESFYGWIGLWFGSTFGSLILSRVFGAMKKKNG